MENYEITKKQADEIRRQSDEFAHKDTMVRLFELLAAK